jgi:DNA (cytosine-5)-methyltransferase 1
VENVAALLDDADAFGWMLGDLAEDGFDADWTVLSACTVGAPHTRARLFLVAHPHSVDGRSRLGHPQRLQAAVEAVNVSAGPWTDPVDGFVEAASRGRGVADGVPDGLEPARVRALGNAVVPQVAEVIGCLIRTHAERSCATAAAAGGGWTR